MNASRVALAVVITAVIAAFFVFDAAQYLQLDYLKARRAFFIEQLHTYPIATALVYFLVYVVITGLSVPGAAILTLIGGAIFGLVWGTVIISFAATIGATVAFLASRFLFRDAIQRRFGDRLVAVNRGMEKDGAFYLFSLRLLPIIPFFVINLLMGLTRIRPRTFYWVSQIGMLPATIVYVNAGTQLAQIESTRGLLSPTLLGAFALLAVFPLLAKWIVDRLRRRRALRGYPTPRRFDRNLIVIGAGAAGLVAAYIAAAVRAKVTLIEKHKMGGECLNTGCVPSKALIRSARFLAEAKTAQDLGFRRATVEFDFADVMARVRRVIRTIEPHDSAERYTRLGVECIAGEARIVSPYEVEVNGRRLSARGIVVATGSEPAIPAIPGLSDTGYHTSDTVWDLTTLPRRLLVLGGGAVGCELAQCFARFGAEVTLVNRGSQLLGREDAEFGALIAERLRADGVTLRLGQTVTAFRSGANKQAILDTPAGRETLEFDEVLLALGRRPRTAGFGLEALGVRTTEQGTVELNEYLQTSVPTIFACGDVAGPYQFTHTASHQAWYAAVNALFGGLKRFKIDYAAIPWCTFTDPEVARVGLNEREAKQRGVAYEVTTFDLAELDRAITDEQARGLVKVLTVPDQDRILGVTIAGAHAGEYIVEFVGAMRHRIGLNKILSTVHIYPTFAEASKYAAGAWKRSHAPEGILRWVERYHRWRRR
ncbi:MAG: FAD-dependent oxidoreductase [Gammaproteobacteria bacterium]